ncbi:MAG: hypothetical protein WDN06_05785 [Asticcacaulis sp.]
MSRGLAVLLILMLAGTAFFFGWRASHRTEVDAMLAQATASAQAAVAQVLPSDN